MRFSLRALKKLVFFFSSLFFQFSFSAHAQEIEVPIWFDGARYQVHSRLQIGQKRDFENRTGFYLAPKYLGEMGVRVHTRHLKSGCEGAIWESKVGLIHPAVEPHGNIAKKIIDASHQAGLKIICYYRHMEDCDIVVRHPEWQCRDKSSGLIEGRRGPWISLASPYLEFLTTRLDELVGMGADGFYFDGTHIPYFGDYSAPARKLYFDTYGSELANASDSQANDFRQLMIEKAFTAIRDSLTRRKKDIVLLLSANTVALKTLKNFYVKWEPNFWEIGTFPDLPIAATVLRDASAGRPTHCWFNESHSDMPLKEVARYLTYNTIINRDISDDALANNDPVILKKFTDEINLVNKISPYFAGTHPISNVLIFIDENFIVRVDKFSESFERVFNQLRSEKSTVGAITREQIEYGVPESCKLLIFPNLDTPPDGCLKAVNKFLANGGKIMYKSDLANQGKNLTMNIEKKVRILGGGKNLDVSIYGDKSSSDFFVVLSNANKKRVRLRLNNENKALRITDIVNDRSLKVRHKRQYSSVVLKNVSPMAFLQIENN